MDDFGDYIYLIVIAIAAVSSILGKKRKKAMEEQSTVPDFPDLDDVVPEYTEHNEPMQPYYQEFKQKVKSVDIPSYDTVDDISVLRAKKQVVNTAKHFVGSELTVSEGEDFNIIELDTPDDVKKAFIYSEIFHRKY